jgi:hypothetical protein
MGRRPEIVDQVSARELPSRDMPDQTCTEGEDDDHPGDILTMQ